MKKGSIALITVFLIAISSLSMVLGQTHLEQITIEDGLPFDCYNIKLVTSGSETLAPGRIGSHTVPLVNENCYYMLLARGCALCGEGGSATFYITYYTNQTPHPFGQYTARWLECTKTIEIPLPGTLLKQVEKIEVQNDQYSQCPIVYSWELYSMCPCENKQALYTNVDIEQFSVTGGSTIIKDGKITSAFNVVPGVQQTMIQVENRGFFTQKDARVRFIGLPEGVTVQLTPATQTIKAHNIGTYSATFTVGSNVPSGTYNISMVAFSPNGVFDTIVIRLVVP